VRTYRTGWRTGAGRLRVPSSPPRHVGRIFAFSIYSQHIAFTLRDSAVQLTVESERISYAATREMMSGPRLLEAESDGSHRAQPLQTYSPHLAHDSCRDGIYD
jgi:hypothetical protein